MKKLNLNHFVKVKFTDHGKDIFYHQYDELNKIMEARGVRPLTPEYPKIDESGYSTMQLWHFMNLFGPHIFNGAPAVIKGLYIYIDERDLDEVDAPLEAVIPLWTKEV